STTAGKEDTPLPLEIMDERVDGAGLEGSSADQKRVERKCLAQVFVLHERSDRFVDRAIGAQLHQRGCAAEHVGEAQKGNVRELGVAGVENVFAVVDEARVAFTITGISSGDFVVERLSAGIIDDVAVAPDQ